MIVDLEKFIAAGRPGWSQLDALLARLEADPDRRLTLAEAQEFHECYERTAADLARITTFSAEPATRRYLEQLVARAYAELHETRDRQRKLSFREWFFRTWPQTFRRHGRAFALSVAITLAGMLFGGVALLADPGAKSVLMPFEHLLQDPAHRVAEEESATTDRLAGEKATFSAELMTHNTRIAIFTFALGISWGVGTVITLFYNGVTLGAVVADYLRAGQAPFLFGWLMPHGVIEIPAILIAGQAGLLLAGALVGHGRRVPLRDRLRALAPDLATLIAGAALLLGWAGLVEAFLSQYHEPVIPYAAKITFGVVELALLILFLTRAGAKPK